MVKLKWYDYVISAFQAIGLICKLGIKGAHEETDKRLVDINRKLWRAKQGIFS